MRIIAIINQKGGVGKTTTVANLGAALAKAGKRVVVFDMDPQANLSLYLGSEVGRGEKTVYDVLTETLPVAEAIRATSTDGLQLVASHLDLSGAELELASTLGRETLLRDALSQWVLESVEENGPADYVLLDCPPSLGLLSVNALVAADEVMIAVQTEFFALQGLSKLVEVIHLLRRRMNPALTLTGIIPCLYDSRLKLAREVLVELRRFFPGKVFSQPIRTNVRLAESPSFGQTIFEYAPGSNGAKDYAKLAREILAQPESGSPQPKSTAAAQSDEQAAELERAAEGLKEVELTPEPQAVSPPTSPPVAKETPAQTSEDPPEEPAVEPQAPAAADAKKSADASFAAQTPDEESIPAKPEPKDGVAAELEAYELPRAGPNNHQTPNKVESFGAGLAPSRPKSTPSRAPALEPSGELALEAPPRVDVRQETSSPEESMETAEGEPAVSEVDAPSPAPATETTQVVELEAETIRPEELAIEESVTEAPEIEEPETEEHGHEESSAEDPIEEEENLPVQEVESAAEEVIEAAPEPKPQPKPTPVFGFSAYIGEDRWTQRPQ